MFASKFSVFRCIPKSILSLRTVYCAEEPKKSRRRVLTIIGGNTGEGQLTALLLKHSNVIEEIRLYSGTIDPCPIAMDLNHIDTGCHVKSYFGQARLKQAITDANIILLCGGQPSKPCRNPKEIFEENADYVRNIALHIGEFNPQAFLCISTSPANSMVPMVAEVLKKSNGFDPRKVFGITIVATSKSNSLLGRYLQKNPADLTVPLVGGTSRHTIVPVFSQVKPCTPVEQALADLLHEKVTSSEDMILDLKNIENTGSCYIIGAYACSKFITSLLKATSGCENVIECAYVRQTGHIQSFLPYMTSIVRLGPEGVTKCHMPKLNKTERQNLEKAYPYLKKHIELGQCFVNGENPKECRMHPRISNACEIVSKKSIGKVGDIILDTDLESTSAEKGIEIIR